MKNYFILAFVVLMTITACSDKKNFARFAGTIENSSTDSIFLVRNGEEKTFVLQFGEFNDTLKINESGFYEIHIGRRTAQVFLSPGDSLFVSADMNDFEKSIVFGGSSEKENNFLAQKNLRMNEFQSNMRELYSSEPADFQKELLAFKEELDQQLEVEELNPEFKNLEKKNNYYFQQILLLQYPMAYKYFNRKEPELPTDFMNETETINLDDEEEFLAIPAYREFLKYSYGDLLGESESLEETLKLYKSINSGKIKDGMMGEGLLNRMESAHPDSRAYMDFIRENSNDKELIEIAEEIFAEVEKLLPGSPSPKFNYPDINGKMISLDDLKGNLVYVDVWATWCGPCLREIPSLKELQTDYSDKNIQFVSMSIDPKEDFGKWQKMVKDRELEGVQLFSDKDWKSEFVREYGIKGIPRFILIDQNGNILLADAPRPSDPEIRTLLDKHL